MLKHSAKLVNMEIAFSMRWISFPAILLSSLTLFSTASQAHPHSWIDMKTYIQGDKKQITGFKMVWTFDAMTTAYMLDGEDMSPESKTETLARVGDSVMKNMMNEHYFTYFYNDQEPIKYKIATDGVLTKDRAKATLTFELPLSKPQPLTKDSLRLLIFEPSYYVDMSWKAKNDIILSPELSKVCTFDLVEPNPSPEQMLYAQSLPPDADPDNALGQLFTQTVKLHCQSAD
ncbi:DUF1007 domain-containing protein [Photobacterium sp. GB-27]|uniref:DUF1007 domain-containing protein n=2 Tax=Vibrionaceae TaxID=641 RepID=Q1ZUM7_PHOAS|nr:hypothetical protein VAS14_13739 [Photobacterium angustum S14]PSV27847.1 DUF1007 domain-containing protein [Photobacterium sp. GB-56]PSV32011.1 DUF1007 domain-containing protein [Photobacterium sp. GB-72]PSV32144.1 DUF1007 domain-containing protein [Photobacterium sp. GB-27]PSV36221.1 DUF1007 domain-containing protein [Photobacterium sp. GB-210]PSV40365.1 DUF1007 domain-containing protein [Photobacterium sp. GB-36]PSV51698.1 DUF1007 domain-containing protein [Photobacterium sp. GB-1]PSV52